MTPLECCKIGALYAETGERDLRLLEKASRQHASTTIDGQSLERELRRWPEIVDNWLRWSEDKRWAPAWYFSQAGAHYIVGYYATKKAQCHSKTFADRFRACTEFIVHELEDYRMLLEHQRKW